MSSVEEQIAAMRVEVDAPLHPDLAAALVETDMLGTWIKHPLYHGPATFAGTANKVYEQKCRMVEEYLAERNVFGLLFCAYERPYRPGKLLEHSDLLSDEEYWSLLADVWIDTEFPGHNWDIWDTLLHSERPGREAMMEPEDHEIWNHFTAEPVTVYRGLSADDEDEVDTDGFAWTTHLPTAQWFARRFSTDGTTGWVATGLVMRSDVIAYFARRSEHEVLVHPENVNVTKMEVVV